MLSVIFKKAVLFLSLAMFIVLPLVKNCNAMEDDDALNIEVFPANIAYKVSTDELTGLLGKIQGQVDTPELKFKTLYGFNQVEVIPKQLCNAIDILTPEDGLFELFKKNIYNVQLIKPSSTLKGYLQRNALLLMKKYGPCTLRFTMAILPCGGGLNGLQMIIAALVSLKP